MNATPIPWYRLPYVWLVLAAPLAAVVMGAVLLTLATLSYDGLVADDYYKRGMEIDRQLARAEKARSFNISAAVTVDAHGAVSATIESEEPLGATLDLSFAHATASERDVHVQLRQVGGNLYAAVLEQDSRGFGYLQLATPEWRITKREQAPLKGRTVKLNARR